MPAVPAPNDVCFQYLDPDSAIPEIREGPFGITRLDRAIKLAAERNIRLILTLTNYFPDYGGMHQYQKWLGLPVLNDFYRAPAATMMFKHWLGSIIARHNALTSTPYIEDPTILAWEIANEPRCPGEDPQVLTDWITEISAFMRSKLRNQLIAAGEEGFLISPALNKQWLY